MSNRIVRFEVHPQARPPSEAEVEVVVVPERLTPATELRGRVTGPRSSVSTIEVAYPLRPAPAPAAGTLAARTVVPEASLWDPERPFVYTTAVELWQDGQRCDQGRLNSGFRTVQLGPRGLRWNGWPTTLRGTTRMPDTVAGVREVHQGGYNLLVGTVPSLRCWATALQFGFLILARLTLTEEAVRQAESDGTLACCLGWLLSQEDAERAGPGLIGRLRAPGTLVGVELDHAPTGPLPEGVSFVVAPEALLPALEGLNLPRVACGPGEPPTGERPGLLGWIRTEAR